MSTKNQQSRITIDIPADIHKKFKSKASVQGKSMRAIVLHLINEYTNVSTAQENCSYNHIPNERLSKAIENVEKGKNLVRTKDLKDLFKKLKA